MVRWTDPTIVKDRIGEQTNLSDDEIKEMIDQAQGYIQTVAKLPNDFSFDYTNTAHLGLYRRATTDLAALYVLAASTRSSQTLNQFSLTADILRDSLVGTLKQITGDDYETYVSESTLTRG